MNKLKKCPFCGGEAALTKGAGNTPTPEVYCRTCMFGIKRWKNEQAIKAWNTRVGDKDVSVDIEKVIREYFKKDGLVESPFHKPFIKELSTALEKELEAT